MAPARKRTIAILLIALIVIVLFGGPIRGFVEESTIPNTITQSEHQEVVVSQCRKWVDGLSSFLGEARFFRDPERNTLKLTPFEWNDVFKVLPNIHVTPGFALDYVFSGPGVWGSPIAYVRPMPLLHWEALDDVNKAMFKAEFF